MESAVAVIVGQKDTLHVEVDRFEQRALTSTVFLNSVPKSGTHLLRNIVRMFVPNEQQWHNAFIQYPNLRANLQAFSPARRYLSWGHLLFTDDSALALRDARHIVLVRDPYDWVLARARFFLSDEFQGPMNHIKNGAAHAEDVLNMAIFGVHDRAPSLRDIYDFNAAAWMGSRAVIVRYEDIVENLRRLEDPKGERFFRDLLTDCGVDLPEDWRERVRIGSDRKHSSTARENLKVTVDIPETLPATQRRLVDYAAPGLRQLLGYV
ncbi:hypothetical protein CSW64_14255 [Caulobacter mirabilis]|uniref:Sulfotransferase domain-containing protein n=1 Tax=Caulobacter mirabilis TaxID=69666 RepID=A0A2D2AZQ1_9CAUL|nr:hypothetical protein CSW64_14255 [Caulobacter mirabilis]